MTEQQKNIFNFIINEMSTFSNTVLFRVHANVVQYIPHEKCLARLTDKYVDIVIKKHSILSTFEHLLKYNISFSLMSNHFQKTNYWYFKDNEIIETKEFLKSGYECDYSLLEKDSFLSLEQLLQYVSNNGGKLHFNKDLNDILDYTWKGLSSSTHFFNEDDTMIEPLICDLYCANVPFQIVVGDYSNLCRVINFNDNQIQMIYDKHADDSFYKKLEDGQVDRLRLIKNL